MGRKFALARPRRARRPRPLALSLRQVLKRSLAEAGDAERVLVAELDRASFVKWRDGFPALRDMRRGLLGDVRVD
jgi:predicted amidohydrolase